MPSSGKTTRMDDPQAHKQALRMMGDGAFLDDRGAHFGKLRYIVAPGPWPRTAMTWQFGVGPTWEDAFLALNAAFVKHALVPIADALGRYSFSAHDEHRMYHLLEGVLTDAGLAFVREHRLDAKSRLDFWFPELRTAMEVKVQGAPHRVLAQVRRYAEHEAVSAVLLVSTLAKLARTPETLAGKPARAVRLAGSFG